MKTDTNTPADPCEKPRVKPISDRPKWPAISSQLSNSSPEKVGKSPKWQKSVSFASYTVHRNFLGLGFSKLFKMFPTCIPCIALHLIHFANSCWLTTKLTSDGATEQLCLKEMKMVEKKARIVCQCSFLDSGLRKSRFAARGGCLRAPKDWMRDLKGTLEQVPRRGVKIVHFPARTQLINFAQWRYTNQ